MKIYTKTGDKGTTSLFGGERVDKNSARIRAYGDVDELNSMIGVIVVIVKQTMTNQSSISGKLLRIQSELFVLGCDLATPLSVKLKIPRINKAYVTRLEKEIDYWQGKLPLLRNFILPGGTNTGSSLHMARAIARRVERSIVELSGLEKINKYDLVYINRLSDWLFVLARYVNKLDGVKEVIWKGRKV